MASRSGLGDWRGIRHSAAHVSGNCPREGPIGDECNFGLRVIMAFTRSRLFVLIASLSSPISSSDSTYALSLGQLAKPTGGRSGTGHRRGILPGRIYADRGPDP